MSANQATDRSPFAGCAILIAGVGVMIFLVGFSILTLFRQYGEIVKFTSTAAQILEISPLEKEPGKLNALADKIRLFNQQLSGDEHATLALNAEELNLAIAAYEPFKDLRGTLKINQIQDQFIWIQISFQLNGKPRLARADEKGWVTSDSRYLNGVLKVKPIIANKELSLMVEDIIVPGAVVPKPFMEQMSPYRLMERYIADKEIGPAMAKLNLVEVIGGELRVSRIPGALIQGEIGNHEVDMAGSRFFLIFGLACCAFLSLAGIVVWVGLVKKRRLEKDGF